MGLIVPNIVSAFAILRLYHAFKSYPKALIEAAHLDGATDWGVLWRTMIPNLRSSIASIGILLFITVWNDYFWPSPDNQAGKLNGTEGASNVHIV